MNCNEVTAILDDGRMDKLDPGQRRQVDAHKASCVVCAREWNAQAAIAALPDMAMPAGLAMQCRAVVAAPRVESPRGGRRWVLVGSLTALAAAAAVIVWLLRPAGPEASAVVARMPEPVDAKPADDPLPAQGTEVSLPAAESVEAPAQMLTVRVIPAEIPPALRRDSTADASVTFVQGADLEKVRADANDPVRVQAMQELSAAVVQELRRIPGLALVNIDPVKMEPASRHYRVRIATATSIQLDGHVAPTNNRDMMVSLGAEQVFPDGKSARRTLYAGTMRLVAGCTDAAPGPASSCLDPAGTARAFVAKMKLETLPPDDTVTRPLYAKLADPSQDVAQRLAALADLYALQDKTGEIGLLRSAGVMHSVIELAKLVEPAQRAQLWRTMRGVGNPALIDSLLLSLSQDPDDVRVAAIEALGADFRGEARVRSTLEAVAASDARPLVRAVAERAVSGEEPWRRYVVRSLEDTSLSPEQRLEALAYYLYPREPTGGKSHPDYAQITGDLDDAAVRAFAEVIPKAGPLAGNVNNNLLGNIAARHIRNPAISDMLLEVLGSHPQPRFRMGAAQLLGQAQPNVPRVHEALVKAAQSDPDAGVRSFVRQVLGDKAP